MINFSAFGKLRLAHFVAQEKLVAVENWEFMGNIWVGETYGFTEWLRLEDEPQILRSLSLDLDDLELEIQNSIWHVLDLPLRQRMKYADISDVIGKADEQDQFINDRISYKFAGRFEDKYTIDCTVHEDKGLIYAIVMAPLPTRAFSE